MPSTWLITGVSSGIGLDLCRILAARGDKVYGTCRTRASSLSNEDKISSIEGDLTIIEGIDVADDGVGEKLKAALGTDVTLDYVVHNAGTVNGARDVPPANIFPEQSLANVTSERMISAFQVNALGPLRVQQALTPRTKSPGGKVAVISTGFASISDCTSGGALAYRASKAAANMLGKCMAVDLAKDGRGIAVAMIAPGMVATEFGPGYEKMKSFGADPVEKATAQIVKTLEELTIENTGKFFLVKTKFDEVVEMPW